MSIDADTIPILPLYVVEGEHCRAIVAQCGTKKEAARVLEIDRKTLDRHLQTLESYEARRKA